MNFFIYCLSFIATMAGTNMYFSKPFFLDVYLSLLYFLYIRDALLLTILSLNWID